MPVLKPLTKFVLTIVGGAMVGGGPVAGTLYFLFPSDSISGSGKASNPRLVIAKVGQTNSELSFNYDSFSTKEVGKPVTFAESKMNFNGYQLKDGDILCSPNQNGKFFVLKEISPRTAQLPKYRVMGYSKEYIVGNDCIWHRFPAEIRQDESKTVYLKNLAKGAHWGRHSVGVIDTIYISSCSFVLKNKENGTFDISWQGCRMDESRHNFGNSIPTTSLGASYEIK